MLVGFLVGISAVLWELGSGRSLRGVIEGMFFLRSVVHLELEYTDSIAALAAAIEAKDPYTQGHTVRVAELACQIGRELQLSPERLRVIARSGLLHDVGKLAVPDYLIRKQGSLTEDESAAMRQHPRLGHDILRRIGRLDDEIMVIVAHHEWMDGSGYPLGLAGEQIPLEARVVEVADVFDALTTDRPYRAALTRQDALVIMQNETGAHLDPLCMQALMRILDSNSETSTQTTSWRH